MNPEEYCIKCHSRYGATDECCAYCGFDPVNNAWDEKEYDKAVEEWKNGKQR